MLPASYGSTVTLVQAGLVDDPYSGQPGLDWGNPTRTPIVGCVVYPYGQVGNESVDVGRPEIAQQTLTVLLPAGYASKISQSDRIEYQGHEFEVIGFGFDYLNPFTGWAPGGQITIRRRQG